MRCWGAIFQATVLFLPCCCHARAVRREGLQRFFNELAKRRHAGMNLLEGGIGKIQTEGVAVPALREEVRSGHIGDMACHGLLQQRKGVNALWQSSGRVAQMNRPPSGRV